jgi:hypothetical protein
VDCIVVFFLRRSSSSTLRVLCSRVLWLTYEGDLWGGPWQILYLRRLRKAAAEILLCLVVYEDLKTEESLDKAYYTSTSIAVHNLEASICVHAI